MSTMFRPAPVLSVFLAWLVVLTIPCARAQTLAEALDQPALTFTVTSTWQVGGSGLSHDGVDAVQTSVTNGNPSIRLDVTGPARVSWWWRKSVANGAFRFSSSVNNGAPITTAAGTDWLREEWIIPAGLQTLTWQAENYTLPGVTFRMDELEITNLSAGYRGIAAWDLESRGGLPVPHEPLAVKVQSYGPGNLLILRSDGTLRATGALAATVPAGLTNVTDFSIGGLALHSDGTVTGWGTTVPQGITDAVQVVAKEGIYMVLRRTGQTVMWGNHRRMVSGPTGVSIEYPPAVLPEGAPKFTALTVGGSWAFGITADGKVAGMGIESTLKLPYNMPLTAAPVFQAEGGGLEDAYYPASGYTQDFAFFHAIENAGSGAASDVIAMGTASGAIASSGNGLPSTVMLGLRRDGALHSPFIYYTPPASASPLAAVDVYNNVFGTITASPAAPHCRPSSSARMLLSFLASLPHRPHRAHGISA